MAKKKISKIEKFQRELQRELNKSNTPPFIFAGSGLSIRYYGVPTWLDLLEQFVLKYNTFFKYDFGYYSSKVNGDHLQIASELANEFHQIWWKNTDFKISRDTYKNISSKNSENAFKIELCNFIKEKMKLNISLKNEIDLLKNSVLSGVMTTNWDDFLQINFNDFEVKIGQKEILFSNQHSIGDIYKIHGCISQPESLIVTKNDYNEFEKNNHYLKSKILTLFVDFPIIFIGYSISDPNIRNILQNIIDSLNNDYLSIEKLQNRLFFVEWVDFPFEPTIENSTYQIGNRSIPIKKIKAHKYDSIFEVLNKVPRKFPVNILR